MAARQDQTLQILSICLVGLVVILGGFLIMVNRWKADYQQQADAATKQSQDDRNALRTKVAEAETMLGMMGFKDNDNIEDVQKQFDTDIQNYGGTFAESDRNYRFIVESFFADIENSSEQESQAKKRLQEAEQQRQEEVAQKESQIAEYKKQVGEVKADNSRLRTEFNDGRAAFEAKRQELEQTLAESRSDSRNAIEAVEAKLASTEETLAKKDQSLQKLIEERKLIDPSLEVADGRVTWVNQRNRTVWINLGEGDSLRPQITFSVYEQDLADAGKSEKKGSIEVVRILDNHLAEARITGDSTSNPIMPGDHIYSPVWHRGKQIHYAMVGEIDLDGDGRNDIDVAQDLIRLNGGVVDSVMGDDGTVQGELTVETRYLVIGDYPRSGSHNAADKIQGWKQMTSEAETIGVETITLQEFLNQMGYKPLDRSVGLGDNSRPEDFKKKGSGFRQRSPYVPISM